VYLDVPSSAITSTDVQLMFNFGTSTATRSWNIKIAMLPCGAFYLGKKSEYQKSKLIHINYDLLIRKAPTDCLQYFSTSSGKVKSFNWQDVAGTTITRQLNNQKYNICFRTELVSGSVCLYCRPGHLLMREQFY
jgi:hypothetical protein